MSVEIITDRYRADVNRILKEEWDCPPCISRGRAIDTTCLPGFVFLEAGAVIGVVTYRIDDGDCEMITLNALQENRGIGTALVEAALAVAKEKTCNRLWLVTTNDDINAIRFYQKRGFTLVAAHLNAMDVSRQMKPSIPLIGMDGIPLQHELEFAIQLS